MDISDKYRYIGLVQLFRVKKIRIFRASTAI